MNIILGVTGGIAAYKSILLLRQLTDAGYSVQVVMTEAAQQFVAPLTFQALSGRAVRSELFDAAAENAMDHIALARWADAIVVVPASADFIARLRAGMANDLLTTLCLATEAPILLAPAMNRVMWANPATQENVQVLQQRGVHIIAPESGPQACGEVGEGRMSEPAAIFSALEGILQVPKKTAAEKVGDPPFWVGKRVLMTAGPTFEAVDPVRFIGNRSSGKMGFALAEALAQAGAQVTLIAGPVSLPTPPGVERIDAESAEQMLEAVLARLSDTDMFISTAAVADWRVAKPAEQKLKKQSGQDSMTLELVRNPDIVATVAQHPERPRWVVGFAAETDNLLEHAREKLQQKGLDMIVANQVGDGRAFGQADNEAWLLHRDGRETHFPLRRKEALAEALIQTMENWLNDSKD
ncbi:phosphopantothenoylcysteine decarboxylase / phosphopantothenate--cysteine ligase [Sulfurivirga caldicuralii]|uniref:Coenzyme A biosynthesis bifunctional protein CoaBC n=1 Tax=Sulfurivirga caldicuralii TaxID=364032 RepID=A0A1N6DNH8_9GAMM|nr:bifunctional phosphopantothenoylcysteine decarboxylase/phosphopantothenate--cysteine ligase CoaBC [Sulfurivirga caldicuralii]SIN72234.1 phosphopantothenoylcysteine decarboxylase / phosphopantothenate--cysteine ligase [Sulfurivirga caldicuralii]